MSLIEDDLQYVRDGFGSEALFDLKKDPGVLQDVKYGHSSLNTTRRAEVLVPTLRAGTSTAFDIVGS